MPHCTAAIGSAAEPFRLPFRGGASQASCTWGLQALLHPADTLHALLPDSYPPVLLGLHVVA